MIRFAQAAGLAALTVVAFAGAAQAGPFDPPPRIPVVVIAQQTQRQARPDLTVIKPLPALRVYTPAPAPQVVRAQPAARAAAAMRAAPAARQ